MKKGKNIKGTFHKSSEFEAEAPTYYECPVCGFLSADKRFGTGEKPCPHCKADAGDRREFPPSRLRRLDSRIRQYHEEGESEIVVILAETFLEALLEDIINRILTARGADLQVREIVLDGQRAIGARIGRLFPHLTGESFEDAAAEMGFRDFPMRWRKIRQSRNAFIHDSPFNSPQERLDDSMAAEAMCLLDQAYKLFVSMNNRFVADGERGRLTAEHGHE
jgi:ribosomal protein L37AE/L43A